MRHRSHKFLILLILLIMQPIKIAHSDIIDSSPSDRSTKYGSARDKLIVNTSRSYQSTPSDTVVVDDSKTDNSTDLSSLFLNIGFATDLFITDNPFDLETTTLLFCGNIDVGKVIYKAIGISAGYSNCNGSGSTAHKAKLQLLLQRKIDKNKFGLTPYLTAGIKYQSLKLRDSKKEAFNAFGTNASIGIMYNNYSFLISAEIDFTYTLFFRESSSPTHALIVSALIKIGVLF